MATLLTSSTFSNTYKDDYLDSDGYHKILFNSGRTLQARELTQLQTILQKQIERFGNNIFKEGAVVKPGGLNLNQKFEFIKLNTSVNALPSTPSSLIGTLFTGQTSGVIAKVIDVVAATGSDPATLYVHYTSTLSSTDPTTSPIRMTPGENIDNGSTTLTVQTTNTAVNKAVGTGSRFSIAQGIYYTQGHFVFTEDQSKIVSKYSDAPNADVGFKVIEDVVTTADDNDLFDNQGSTPNLSAPGADRYRIRLVIATSDEIDSDENFVHVGTIKDGVIFNAVTETDAYNVPNKLIAQRIFENSGNYIVKPFKVSFENDSDTGFLNLKISDGVAVVEGFRAARYFPSTLRFDKATDTVTINNEVVAANFGNYVNVTPANTKGLPNIDTFEQLTLKDSTNFAGASLGTARVKAVAEDGANYRYHLFDIQMNAGKAFRNVKSIGADSNSYFNPTLEASKAVIKDAATNSSLFRLPKIRPQTISDISLAVQRRRTGTSDGAGELSLTVSGTGETWTNTGDWIVAGTDSSIFTGSFSVSGAGTQNATITGLPPSKSLEVLTYVNKASASTKTKTLTTKVISATIDSDGNGVAYLPLGKADIFDVSEIVNAADSNQDFSGRFTLDNGQRDNYYALGRLLLNSGASAPGVNVHVSYRYFAHSTSGDFFAVNSYSGQVAYSKIPSYRLNNGTTISLRNYLDFRSVVDSDGNFANTSTGARVIELPQPTDLVQQDVTYYLAQSGKLIIDTEGVIKFIRGNSEFRPKLPQKPEQALGLYDIFLGPNTLNDSDILVRKIEHKRFTMKDIAQLEKRVDKLEEITSLSLLEIDTKNFEVLDSAGTPRTKAGFFVDNFSTQILSDTKNAGYAAAVDPLNQILRPTFTEDNVRLIYDSDASTNIIRKGDNLYLKYDEEAYLSQTLASESVRINPFTVVVHEGVVTLSPTSDEWRDTDRITKKVVSGGTKLDTTQAYLWDNWSWNWGGIAIEDLNVGSIATSTTSNTTSGVTNVNKVVAEETIQEVISDKVVNTAVIPFIRSRKVFFKASGLRPNSKVFAFFDNTSVADWVRTESFQYYSDTTTDYGNIYDTATSHPEGSSTLETDANGEVTGSFFIPNTSAIKFRTGNREFKILDISSVDDASATSIARATYSATGVLDTYQEEVLSTRILSVEGQSNNNNPNINYNSGYNDDDDGGSTANSTDPSNSTWSKPTEYTYSADFREEFEDGSSTSSGGTVICTALYNMGELDKDVYEWDAIYGKYVASSEAFSGYYVWAQHVANAMYDKGIIYHMAKPLATAWANQMAHNLTEGKVGKSSLLGKTLKSVGEPICHAIGSFMKLFNIKQAQLG